MNSRLNANEIRQYVTPYVMRFLLAQLAQGKETITRDELLQAGISDLSIQALIQTRRIAPVLNESVDRPDGIHQHYQILIQA